MNAVLTNSVVRLRVRLARAHQLVGWAGLVGIGLAVAALCSLGLAWSAQHSFLQAAIARSLTATPVVTPAAAAGALEAQTSPPELSRLSEVPLLLTQMEQAAVANGLAWRAADYKITAATSTRPASLEVRSNIKGPYPKLRAMLVQLMGSVPAFTIREFNLSRPNSDSAEVEAKLVLAVFLQDEAPGLDASAPRVAQ